MFRNYMMAALRNLARNRLYTGINIVGLGVGFTAAILMALFVRSEFNYDTFLHGYDRVFSVAEVYHPPGGGPIRVDAALPNIAAPMKVDYPAIDTIARLMQGGVDLRVGAIEALDGITWADPGFFKVMPFPVIAGDPSATLARPDGIVLTRAAARKYFGADAPIGETIEIDRTHRMQVGAVVEDIPVNSHLAARIFASGLASFSPLSKADGADRGSIGDSAYTYFRLAPGTSVDPIRADMAAFLERHAIGPQAALHLTPPALELVVVPLKSIHLGPAAFGALTPRANQETLFALAATGGLIVLIAAINYVTLMTARSTKRAVEVGIRKAVGATRRTLVAQFIGESLLYVVIAMVLAMACLELLIPWFNTYAPANLTFAYWQDPVLLGALVALVFIVGVLAGVYPAVALSSFRPAAVLKGGPLKSAGAGVVRMGLVILQFAMLIGIILMTATIYRQTRFALNDRLRVPTDQILLVTGSCDEASRQQIQALPGVRAAACDARDHLSHVFVKRIDGTKLAFSRTYVDFGYLELYGLRPLAGRFFDNSHGADSVSPDAPASFQPNVVINETALQQLGFRTPADALGKSIFWIRGADLGSPPLPSTIIGVAPDFSATASREKIDPVIYLVDRSTLYMLNVKLDGRKIPETLASIDRVWKERNASRPTPGVFLNQIMQRQYMDVIRQGIIFAVFSALALFLACIGLFGLAAFATERRTKEIGIRKAMGADSSDIVRLFAWEFSKPVLWANLLAWPIAYYFANRWINGFAYHVDLEVWMFLAAGGIALAIALITVSGHASLAARAKPVTALRYE
jgi:putative ABC transport system permease protein